MSCIRGTPAPIDVGTPRRNTVVRAHAWLRDLTNGKYLSIDGLASSVKLNPKVVRQALRLAFLAPETTDSILQGSQPAHVSLRAIPFSLPLSWTAQDKALRVPR